MDTSGYSEEVVSYPFESGRLCREAGFISGFRLFAYHRLPGFVRIEARRLPS
jgi:hypothetical protein